MSEKHFKQDLENCIVNVQQRVLLTDFINEYKLPYVNVQRILEAHIAKEVQDFDAKFEKRYMVHGFQKETGKEILTLVAEDKLAQSLQKLNNAESSLFSVELSNGGAKTAAQDLKLLRYYAIGFKDCCKATTATAKVMQEKPIANENNLQFKTDAKKPAQKPLIEVKEKTVEEKEPNAKKLNDFFKKSNNAKKTAANKSMQLIEEDEDEDDVQVNVEMQEANKRQITDDEEQENISTLGSKRRRILDFDNEEDEPQNTANASNVACDNSVEEAPISGTFMDEDGFIITIKPKKSPIVAKKSPTAPKAVKPPIKTPKKSPAKSKPSKTVSTKTKQGNILKFFCKN